jgi:hypothetical protein
MVGRMNKLLIAAALVIASLTAAAPASAAERDAYWVGKDGGCVFKTGSAWCPDWNALTDGGVASDGACVFRQDKAGGFAWCPDWNGAGEVKDGSCVFRPIVNSGGSVAWCPDWQGGGEFGAELLVDRSYFIEG